MVNVKRVAVLCLAAVGVAVSGSDVLAGGPMGTATIKGKAMLSAAKPSMRAIDMGADKACAAMHSKPQYPQGKMVFPDGSIPYAFIYLKDGVTGKYDTPSTPVEIDQQGCMYRPHVFGMIAGQPLLIKNNDDTAHNIHALPKKNAQFNFSQPKKGLENKLEGSKTFTRPEVMVKIKCDVHPWMSAYAGVLSHPFFAVSGKGGEWEIKNVPAGKYTLAIWHEEWGTMEVPIEVADGATVEHTFTYSKAAAQRDVNVREVTVGSGPVARASNP